MDRYEDLYRDFVEDVARESIRQQVRGNAQKSLAAGAQFEPQASGTYTATGYRRNWRFGMKMGIEKLAD